ncbi:hypothetical protein rosag_47180 [Roseisolibacter agri]|uniref:Uncharacterized protein n=1 Tax=Roseisolibacter agri TaxID=2014610 RepID=A0AA37Q7W3_9BACT|nr:hypothetical protein rosag_47180 [Roseisolibacter agri]
MRDELDPLGFVVEHRADRELTEPQRSALRDLCAGLRVSNRADWRALDSLDFVLRRRLGPWLREAHGGLRPRCG